MTVFIDTSAFYAVLDQDDAHHAQARSTWAEILEDSAILLTNNYVLLETTALLQRRINTAAVRVFHHDITPLLQIDWVSGEQNRAAVEAMLVAGRKKLSVVDCVSFQTMRIHGVRTAFCFDTHFHEQGFVTKP